MREYPFKKGRAKTGGRVKGVKNKKSVLQQAFDEVLTPSIAKSLVAAAIRQATTGELDKPQANLLLGLFPFMAVSIPKSFDVRGTKGGDGQAPEEEITEFTLNFKT